MSGRADRQFVDSNVLVYAHDRSAGSRQRRALELVTDLWESGEGCWSIQVCQEFFVTITRKVAQPLHPKTARQIVAYLGTWNTHAPTLDDVLAAIDLQGRHHTSFWDAMVLHSAARLDCGRLWSEDLNHGQVYDGVQVLNPFESQ